MDCPVRDVMTTEVQTLRPTDALQSAAQLMSKHKIGGIPVVEKDELRGIITESDVFRALYRILSFETGCQILVEESSSVSEEQTEYMKLCLKHKCLMNGLLRYARAEGGSITYLSIAGGDIEAFVDDVWDLSDRAVISVERQS